MGNTVILPIQAVSLCARFRRFRSPRWKSYFAYRRRRYYPDGYIRLQNREFAADSLSGDDAVNIFVAYPFVAGGVFVPAEELISQLSASVLFRLPYKRIVNASPASGPLRLKLARRVAPSSLLSGWLVYNESEPCQSLVGRLVMIFTTRPPRRSHSAPPPGRE